MTKKKEMAVEAERLPENWNTLVMHPVCQGLHYG